VTVELDPRQFVTRPQGRRAWVREGRRVLDAEPEREAGPIPKDRSDRLFEACRRLEEELDVEHASHVAYDAWRARGVAADGSGRMAPGMVKAHEPVLVPSGLMNSTDLDSRPMRTHGYKPLQGYNAQLAVNEQQVVIAAELTCDSPDFGHLEPMVRATQRELRGVDVGDPHVVLADAGYWHQRQIETVSATASRSSFHRTRASAAALAPDGPAGFMTSCDACSLPPADVRSTASARARSSPSSGRSSSTARSAASNAAAERRAAPNGGSSPLPAISSSSTATGSPPSLPRGPAAAGAVARRRQTQQSPRKPLIADFPDPSCESDGLELAGERELTRADVVPMQRVQRVRHSGASVGHRSEHLADITWDAHVRATAGAECRKRMP
jgi:hypothetical protein